MYIKEIIQKKDWSDFLLKQPEALFVQSPAYGAFYESMGEQAWLLGVYEGDALLGGALAVSTHAKRGAFLYVPYGPVFDNEKIGKGAPWAEAFGLLCESLKQISKKEAFDFIKISPFLEDTKEYTALFDAEGFRPAPLHVLAEQTWILDITPEEEQLLANMNKNHRNLIRRCIREGVRVEIKTDDEALKRFNDMHDEVVKRHKFHRFPRTYIEDEFHTFVGSGQAAIFEAYLPDGRLDASSIIMFFGTMANYRHSASLNQNKKIPSSYLIQWHVIQEAKRRGMYRYNFWGIAPSGARKEHPFYGITHFKKGFGGEEKDLMHCQDAPLSGKYWINWIIEMIRKRKRKF
jgi:lipid II:glycine glycyltransferase (peptidoglycan interpeptide bridge formation enzyme)